MTIKEELIDYANRCLAGEEISVSYTHLDVYKRQECERVLYTRRDC